MMDDLHRECAFAISDAAIVLRMADRSKAWEQERQRCMKRLEQLYRKLQDANK